MKSGEALSAGSSERPDLGFQAARGDGGAPSGARLLLATLLRLGVPSPARGPLLSSLRAPPALSAQMPGSASLVREFGT